MISVFLLSGCLKTSIVRYAFRNVNLMIDGQIIQIDRRFPNCKERIFSTRIFYLYKEGV